jgi:Ca2+-transporting ATPase
MSHVWRAAQGSSAIIAAKGALEGILEHCDDAEPVRARAAVLNDELAARGMRVLAIAGAHREAGDSFSGERARDERGLRLMGLVGFHDPVRPSVPSAIDDCQRAGITLKLITGDHPLTAHAVADDTGLAHRDDTLITGAELEAAGEARLAELAKRNSIFARVRPDQKYAIVDALVRGGEIVAMTGDGVNDAPALRRATIGVSMGARATEVARAASGLILLNDDFAALVATIREGRGIFANIQHAFRFLIGMKTMIVLVAFAPAILGMPILLTPLNILWLELIVHGIAAMVYQQRDAGAGMMERPPRDTARAIVDAHEGARSAFSGALAASAAVLGFAITSRSGIESARGVAMVTILFGAAAIAFAEIAGDRSWRRIPIARNLRWLAACAAITLSAIAFTETAALASVLEIAPLSARGWASAITLAVVAVGWRAAGTRREIA